MKKTFLFFLSVTVAFGITMYLKDNEASKMVRMKPHWETFEKTPKKEISNHVATKEELIAAKIALSIPEKTIEKSASTPDRQTASLNPFRGFMVRKNRILMGEINQKYEDENHDLTMLNAFNPKWKEIMGMELMRFQPEDTKLMVKEEVPVIKIVNGKGLFLEQVSITYLQKDGNRQSFKALIDSGSGAVVETWDRTVHEKINGERGGLGFLPSINESGIITR